MAWKPRTREDRSCLARFLCLAALLRSGKPFTGNEAAARFECSIKTIYRDMEYMRDRFGFECEWDKSAKTWRLLRAPRPVLL